MDSMTFVRRDTFTQSSLSFELVNEKKKIYELVFLILFSK